MNGKLIWEKDLGVLEAGPYDAPALQWGFASSPVIYEQLVVLQCDVLKNGFLAAFNIEDGKEIWRTTRNEVTAWSTPAVYHDGERTQLIVNGYKHIGGYDVHTGKELWRMAGGGDIPVPTPIVGHGLVFITNAHGGRAPIYAIRLDASGDITPQDGAASNDYIVWSDGHNGNYMQTPLVYGDYLYTCKDGGVMTCYDAKTGKRFYRQRLGTGKSGFTASPVAADDKIYFTSEDGDIYVVQIGPEFNLLAVNSMGEICMATPAISEGVLFFRSQNHLVAVK
jgi:outer membrane protein assembly factor BamB